MAWEAVPWVGYLLEEGGLRLTCFEPLSGILSDLGLAA